MSERPKRRTEAEILLAFIANLEAQIEKMHERESQLQKRLDRVIAVSAGGATEWEFELANMVKKLQAEVKK